MAYPRALLISLFVLVAALALGLANPKEARLLIRGCPQDTAYAGAVEYPAPQNDFTLAVIPDTQKYCMDWAALPRGLPSIRNIPLEHLADWILRQREAASIQFVSHLGDIVDQNKTSRWTAAAASLDRILGAGIPLGIVVGNHDMEPRPGTAELFQQHFPASKFEDHAWYGGSFPQRDAPPFQSGNNVNSFQLISAGGRGVVLLHLECNAPDDVVAWANDVLSQHADRVAIVLTHMFLGSLERPPSKKDAVDAPQGRTRWGKCHGQRGNTGEALWEKLVRKHGNIALVISGDQSQLQTMKLSSKGDAGNTVHQVMIDHGSGRYLRLFHFDWDSSMIHAVTWDIQSGQPLLSTKRVATSGDWQITLPIDVILAEGAETTGL